jgi:TolB-like protein
MKILNLILPRIADQKVIRSHLGDAQYKTGLARDLRKIGNQRGVANVGKKEAFSAPEIACRVTRAVLDDTSAHHRHLRGQTYDRDLADIFGNSK